MSPWTCIKQRPRSRCARTVAGDRPEHPADRRGPGNKGDQVDADALSERLRRGSLRAVYHGRAPHATLKELTRSYENVVEDATRVMLRLKTLFPARGIRTPGARVYHPATPA